MTEVFVWILWCSILGWIIRFMWLDTHMCHHSSFFFFLKGQALLSAASHLLPLRFVSLHSRFSRQRREASDGGRFSFAHFEDVSQEELRLRAASRWPRRPHAIAAAADAASGLTMQFCRKVLCQPCSARVTSPEEDMEYKMGSCIGISPKQVRRRRALGGGCVHACEEGGRCLWSALSK